MKIICRSVVGLLIILVPIISLAAPKDWQIDLSHSEISFTATQNNSPVTGKFNAFKGEIHFDPAELQVSHIEITVDMNSVATTYSEVADNLKSADWFNIKLFPQAIFKADHFIKTGDNAYQGKGTLTIRDKTVPITLNFTLDEYTQDKAHAKGSVTLKRNEFGVGQGEWISTDSIKDDVLVEFTLSATQKK